MKKILLLFTILFVSVITTACINNLAIQELNNKAESYLNNGDTETAICRLKSSLDLDDEIYQTHYNLAIAYNTIGKYKDAVSESKKVIELKPDFKIAYYTLAVAQEGYAFELIENVEDNNNLSLDEISNFINSANESVETYNKYLVLDTKADNTDKINNQIAQINEKIKEFTALYDNKNSEKDKKVQEEVQPIEEPNQEQEQSQEDTTEE